MSEQMSRRTVLALISAGSFVMPAFAEGQAAYPGKQILLIVPYPAGGAVDLAARLVAEKLRLDFGQAVVVENRPGANGMVGAAAVARAQPDGYTLLMAPREVFGINPILMPQQAIDGKQDFAYVGVVATGPYVLVVNPGLGVSSFAEFVDLAKQRELAYASFGKGSMAHLNIEALARKLGVKMVHVPYRGAPPAVTAVATGEVALTITTPPAAISLMQGGKLKPIAVGNERRLPQLSEVPTMAELGVADDPLILNFFGLAAPAGTPVPIVERLNAAVARAITAPEIAAKLEASGLVPAPGLRLDMARLVNEDVERFGRLIRELDIKVAD
ncbi:Bug family tripartite tricarboxylate transporter substrate binding protein [Bosea sp. (in: a-proteobacteria)]|uniref:Bug family tripartite tricarboxylate transporter substrate binding protein n=1 Tax=Bosea sp. (in: a-proteobacteria) TaxID=1871050 RepID=UPI002FCADA82